MPISDGLLLENRSLLRQDQRYDMADIPPTAWERATGMAPLGGDVTPAELGRSLARIESKLDRAIDDHEQRLRRVERWMWTAAGFGGLGAVSGFGALITSIVGQ